MNNNSRNKKLMFLVITQKNYRNIRSQFISLQTVDAEDISFLPLEWKLFDCG